MSAAIHISWRHSHSLVDWRGVFGTPPLPPLRDPVGDMIERAKAPSAPCSVVHLPAPPPRRIDI